MIRRAVERYGRAVLSVLLMAALLAAGCYVVIYAIAYFYVKAFGG